MVSIKYLFSLLLFTILSSVGYGQAYTVEIKGPVNPKAGEAVRYDLVFKDEEGNILSPEQVSITDVSWTDYHSGDGTNPFVSTSDYFAIVNWNAVEGAELNCSIWTVDNYLEAPAFVVNIQSAIPLPAISVSNSGIIPAAGSIVLSVTNFSYDSYQWRNGAGSAISGATNSTYTATQPGIYKMDAVKNGIHYISLERTIIADSVARNMNYVEEHTFVSPGVTDTTDIYILPVTANIQVTRYFDGLGRPIQEVTKKAATGDRDLVQVHEYDGIGRETKKYLPYADKGSDGLYKIYGLKDPNVNSASPQAEQYRSGGQFAFYQAEPAISLDAYPYAENTLEASPLNRPLKTYGPGENWRNYQKHTEYKYLTNSLGTGAGQEKIISWVINSSGMPVRNPSLTNGYYPDTTLFIKSTKDEEGHEIREYTTREGLLILKKVQATQHISDLNDADDWLQTYYIYDDYRQLRYVLQPALVKMVTQNDSDNPGSGDLAELAFSYQYDEKGRMISKRVPGAGIVRMIYDARDRLVMSQDSIMRSNHQWLYTQYDELNRVAATGIITDNSNYNNTGYHQVRADASIAYPDPGGYTSEELTRTFYDNYSWRSSYSNPLSAAYTTSEDSYLQTASNTTWPYAQANNQSSNINGLVTGSRVKVLGTSTYLYSVNFYDDKGRTIQVQSDNITGGTDVVTTQYSWSGQVLMNIVKNEKAGTNTQTSIAITKSTYDDLGRLSKTEKKISNSKVNGGSMPSDWEVVSNQSYNVLGQVTVKNLGENPATNPVEFLEYTYNVRGWLLGMNGPGAKNEADEDHYFGFELAYDKPEVNAGSSSYPDIIGSYGPAQYNGNICGMLWKSRGDSRIRKYDFSYDPVNRLSAADFTQYTAGSFNKNDQVDFSVSGIDYDGNGNILHMNQRGWKAGGSVMIDSLLYTYSSNSNKLLNVLDRRNDPATTLGDFRSSGAYMTALGDIKTAAATDYEYNGNGSLVLDNNKDIGLIHYNYLNLPDSIAVTGKGNIRYVYDAAGNKLKKITTEGAKTTTTLYLFGNYVNDTLQFLPHEEGRLRFKPLDSTLHYDYFLKDHLGNIRMVLTKEQQTDTYPAATMEAADAGRDTLYYSNIEETRASLPSGYPVDTSYSNPNEKVAKLNGSNRMIGPGIVLKVMAGDQFNLRVSSWYKKNGTIPGTPNSPLVSLLSALASSIGNLAAGHTTSTELQATNTLDPGALDFYNSHSSSDSTTKPKAFVNWVLFDEQFKYVGSNSGFEQVGADNTLTIHTQTGLPVSKNGYLYIYTSNETPNINVFFDNLQVTHIRGPILEETHYYPFGLTMKGISSKAQSFGTAKNKRKFNDGSELQHEEFTDGSGLELYETAYRSYDPQIGRFHQIDPCSELSNNWTPYVYTMNNPLRYNDPLGLDTIPTSMNGNTMGIPTNPNQNDVLSITNPDGSISYYTYDPNNPNANSQGYVGSGTAGTNTGVTVTAKGKPKDNSDIEGAGTVQYFLSLTASAAENLGGFENAMHLLEEGKFNMVYNGQLKTWSLSFYGNQSISAELVQANKLAFATKATGNMAFFKAAKAGGVVLNAAGILITVWDMKRNGVNAKNSTDMVMGGIAFIPGVGWIISGVYFTIGATVGWENAIPSYIEVEKNKADMRKQSISTFSDFKN